VISTLTRLKEGNALRLKFKEPISFQDQKIMTVDSALRQCQNQNQDFLRRLVFVIFWSVLFTLAYSQSALFTSNQNQYFLHGYADADYGNLAQDWLANTLDPTPVFSGLVNLTYRLIPWQPVFYMYYGILAGVYLFSLYGIFAKKTDNGRWRVMQWLTFPALLFVNSAGLRALIVRISDPDWAYLFDGGVAGQRLLGSVLQPSTFGVFILLSIFLFLRGKTLWSIFSLVLTATFHPTYLLSAAMLTLVYMGLSFKEKKQLMIPLIIGGTALLGVLPILIHALLTFGGTIQKLTMRSRELLVEFRIPHHAIPAEWLDGSVIIKIALITLALYLTRKTHLFHILCWPFLIGVFGTLVQIVTRSNVIALLFPWRLSTWLVPLSAAAITFKTVELGAPWIEKRIPKKFILTSSVIISLCLAGTGLVKSIWETQEKNNSADRPMMAYVSESKNSGDEYLIPLDMQDFRLETGAPAYIEFKSIPYKDVDVLEWYRRVSLAGNLYRASRKRDGCSIAADLYLEGVTHIVLPYDHTIKNCSNLEKQYVDIDYEVYKVKGE